MLNRLLVSILFVSIFQFSAVAQDTKKDTIPGTKGKVDVAPETKTERKQAKKIYRNTCKIFQRLKVSLIGYNAVGFSGNMVDVSNDIGFAESIYQLQVNDVLYDDFYAEVELVNAGPFTWVVHLNFYNKNCSLLLYWAGSGHHNSR